MKQSAEAGVAVVQARPSPDKTATKRRAGKHSAKPAGTRSKAALSGKKAGGRAGKKSSRGPKIRETEEARALLEDQLHDLYWWVFNACKMKGFIRAKALDKLQRAGADSSEIRTEHDDFSS
jgi:hypothetical protein